MNEKEPTLSDYLDVLYRYRIFVGIVVIVTTLSALIFSFTAPRIYEGEVTLRVALRKVPTPLFTELGPIPQIDPVASEIQIIKARTIAEMVVNREALNVKLNNGLSRACFDTIWVEPTLKKKYLLTSASPGYILLGVAGETLSVFRPNDTVVLADGFGFIVNRPGLSGQIEIKDFYQVADAIRGEIKVSRIRDTDIISLKAKARSPALAARISNAYANSYLDYTLNYMRREARSSKEFIEKQIENVGKKLDQAETKLKTYKESTGIFILDESANQLIGDIAQLEANRAEAYVSRRESEAKLENLNSELEDKSRTFGSYRLAARAPGLSNNPRIQALKKRLSDLELERSELLKTYPKEDQQVKKVDEQITRTRQEIDGAVEKALSVGPSATDPVYQNLVSQLIQTEATRNALEAKISAFDREINRLNRRLSKLPETEVRLAQLQRNAKVNEEIYTMLLNKREEA
ncbi:MAG TPA: hypothetical protein EYP58_02950, partial [bacterium (Candidatus Stahlbacteria)]|nr:hypothetical protein [Candidatus Stahlbacteria bacterium]